MNQSSRIVELARSLHGVPYRHMGRDKTGMDCLGVVIWIGEQIGLRVPPVGDYSRVPSGHGMMRQLHQYCARIYPGSVAPGDIVHIAFSAQPQHLAVVVATDPIRIVHADAERGRVVEQFFIERKGFRLRGAYRLPDRVIS